MTYTIIYTAEDNGDQTAYGNFKTHGAADKRRERMESDLDSGRDAAGGGVGSLQIVQIFPLAAWEED